MPHQAYSAIVRGLRREPLKSQDGVDTINPNATDLTEATKRYLDLIGWGNRP